MADRRTTKRDGHLAVFGFLFFLLKQQVVYKYTSITSIAQV